MFHSSRMAWGAVAATSLLLPSSAAAAPQPEIQAMAAEVSQAELTTTGTDLVAFGTRFLGTAGCDAATNYLVARLQALGLAPRIDSFDFGGRTVRNVTAQHVGLVRPQDVYLVLAHYDSISEDALNFAPGADDDASGVAVVVEAARVLSQHRFEGTVRFLLTSGEEQGIVGGDHDAAQAVATGEGLRAVINHDMVGYWPTGWLRDLDVSGSPESVWLVDAYTQASTDYVSGMPTHGRPGWDDCGDDQVAYWSRGFPSIIVMDCYEAMNGFINGETVPHYHRTTDTLDTVDFARVAEVAQATTATLAVLAVPITRTLYRDDALTDRVNAGATLRPGSPAGGALTRIDPAGPFTTARYNPAPPTTFSGDGRSVGAGAHGTFVFYETDRDEHLDLARRDADGDTVPDVVVSFVP